MGSRESDSYDLELVHGFGSSQILRSASSSGRRRTKRWSFHDSSKPNLVDLPSSSGVNRRRLSDFTGIDGVHKEIDSNHISPAQLYSTESGRLFHAGKICISLAGLPGRGKTHLSVSLTRYLRWLGVKTHLFHLGDYRRASAEDDVDHDLFIPSSVDPKVHKFRRKIVKNCINDMLNFFQNDKGQVAIYDAVNALPEYRVDLYNKFKELNIQTIFIESLVTDNSIVLKNMKEAARSSPDYNNWNYEEAYRDYSERIRILTPFYQEMGRTEEEKEISYVKFINFGERIELHNSNYGYLINKVVFFLMNSRIKVGSVYFARCYNNSLEYTNDPPLDEAGKKYAENLSRTIMDYIREQGKTYFDENEETSESENQMKESSSSLERVPAAGADGVDENSFVIWTSVKRRTIETTKHFARKGIKIRHRIQLSQKNPGKVGNMTQEEIAKKFPGEYEQLLRDPYHHRFSRGELYHDLAIKLEPLILEMERMSGDILIIADDTVLKVLYGYLMACSCYDIPSLHFPMNEIIEIKFNAYSNLSKTIPIKNYV